MSKSRQANPDYDVSLLRPPIELATSGVQQILQTVKVGTEEMKELLFHQCDIIFECKVCRNLFRGLPNFIAHKRVYCKGLYTQSHLAFVETKPDEETVIIQPEDVKSEKSDINCDESDEDSEANTPVVKQMEEGRFEGKSASYKFYTKAVERQNKKVSERKEKSLTLHSIPGNKNAVLQTSNGAAGKDRKTIKRPRKRKRDEEDVDDDDDDDKSSGKLSLLGHTEEEEIVVVEPQAATGHIRMNLRQRATNNRQRSSGSNSAPSLLEQLKKRDDCSTKSLECLKCKATYASIKTLHFHMTTLHSEKRTFYPCLLCSAVFAQIWSVTRHIGSVHDKSRQEVRQMVDKIRAGSFTKSVQEIGEYINPRVPLPTPIPTAKSDKKDGNKANTGDSDAQELQLGLNFVMFRCKGCSKMFGKKHTHDRHVRQCALAKKKDPVSSNKSEGVKTAADAQKTPSASLVQMASMSDISEEEMQKIMAIIDESTQTCLKCYRTFGTISNLHRHAIRHLGWRRFKCKFCKFLSYNRSECRRHLRIVHKKAMNKQTQIERFIDKLPPENIKANKVPLPRVEMQTRHLATMRHVVDGTMRTRAGVYRKTLDKPDTLLVTRSGMYRKPTFKELTKGRGNANSDDGSSDEAKTETKAPRVSSRPNKPAVATLTLDEDLSDIEPRKDLQNSRHKRKATNPCHTVGVNTPATARPASHILNASPTKSPAKSSVAGKVPVVNILSKSSPLPRFTISGGMTTVRLPIFSQCIQIGGGTGGMRPASFTLLHRTQPARPPIVKVVQRPYLHSSIVGTSGMPTAVSVVVSGTTSASNFVQATSTVVAAESTTIVRSENVISAIGPSVVTSPSVLTTETNVVAATMIPPATDNIVAPANNMDAVITSILPLRSEVLPSTSSVVPAIVPSSQNIRLSAANILPLDNDMLQAKSTVMLTESSQQVTAISSGSHMPILCPIQPIIVTTPAIAADITIRSAPPSILASKIAADCSLATLDTSCQLSPAMPTLAPVITASVNSSGALTAFAASSLNRSLTPQPVKKSVVLKPRSLTPGPSYQTASTNVEAVKTKFIHPALSLLAKVESASSSDSEIIETMQMADVNVQHVECVTDSGEIMVMAVEEEVMDSGVQEEQPFEELDNQLFEQQQHQTVADPQLEYSHLNETVLQKVGDIIKDSIASTVNDQLIASIDNEAANGNASLTVAMETEADLLQMIDTSNTETPDPMDFINQNTTK